MTESWLGLIGVTWGLTMSAEGKEGKTCGWGVSQTCGVLLCGVHGKCAWYVMYIMLLIVTVCHVVKRVCMTQRCDMSQWYAMWFPYVDMNHYM